MNKNLIYIVAINFDLSKYSIKAWKYYCNKFNNIDFKVITTKSNENMAPHWERYTIFDRYPNYDNYLYVDADAIVRWDSPNFFKLLPKNKIYAVGENNSLEWVYNGILGYQDLFPDTKVNWWEYFASCFLKFDQSHKNLFQNFIKFFNKNQNEINKKQYETLKKGFDQTPFNYFIRQENYKFELIPEMYSVSHLIKKDIFYNGMFLNIPIYIWQFNAIPRNKRTELMKQIWGYIEKNYS